AARRPTRPPPVRPARRPQARLGPRTLPHVLMSFVSSRYLRLDAGLMVTSAELCIPPGRRLRGDGGRATAASRVSGSVTPAARPDEPGSTAFDTPQVAPVRTESVSVAIDGTPFQFAAAWLIARVSVRPEFLPHGSGVRFKTLHEPDGRE